MVIASIRKTDYPSNRDITDLTLIQNNNVLFSEWKVYHIDELKNEILIAKDTYYVGYIISDVLYFGSNIEFVINLWGRPFYKMCGFTREKVKFIEEWRHLVVAETLQKIENEKELYYSST